MSNKIRSAIRRMEKGDLADWKWLYCRDCELEWLVPAIPDLIPKFCCSCCKPIDPTLTPDDVLPPEEPDPPAPEISVIHNFPPAPKVRIQASITHDAYATVRPRIDCREWQQDPGLVNSSVVDLIVGSPIGNVEVELEFCYNGLCELFVVLESFLDRAAPFAKSNGLTPGIPDLEPFLDRVSIDPNENWEDEDEEDDDETEESYL